MTVKTVPAAIRSVYCVLPGGTVAHLTSLCQPVTDWLHTPDRTGVVWGLYTCCWRRLNISIPNLQKLHICGRRKWVRATPVLTIKHLRKKTTRFILTLASNNPLDLFQSSQFNNHASVFPLLFWVRRLLMNPSTALWMWAAAADSASFECSSFLIHTSP